MHFDPKFFLMSGGKMNEKHVDTEKIGAIFNFSAWKNGIDDHIVSLFEQPFEGLQTVMKRMLADNGLVDAYSISMARAHINELAHLLTQYGDAQTMSLEKNNQLINFLVSTRNQIDILSESFK